MRWASFFVVRVRAKLSSTRLSRREFASGQAQSKLITKRHHRVNGPKHDERERKWNVNEQPAVQPVMQPFLPDELTRLIANLFQILQRGLRRDGQERLQSGEALLAFAALPSRWPRFFGLLQKSAHFREVEALQRRALFRREHDSLREQRPPRHWPRRSPPRRCEAERNSRQWDARR